MAIPATTCAAASAIAVDTAATDAELTVAAISVAIQAERAVMPAAEHADTLAAVRLADIVAGVGHAADLAVAAQLAVDSVVAAVVTSVAAAAMAVVVDTGKA